jgi:hypothetical protein
MYAGQRSARGMWVRRVAVVIPLALIAAFVAMASPPQAKAITCIRNTAYTGVDPGNSDRFYIANNSQCADLNAAYTVKQGDYIRGKWYGSGGWHDATRGYQWVQHTDTNWNVLLTSVANGTMVLGQAYKYGQNVVYVT